MTTFGRIATPAALLLLSLSASFAQSLQTGYAEIEGRKVYYETKGRGAAVVLIHGFSLDRRMWDPQFDTLARYCRVLRYDVSGYGRSSVADSLISPTHELAALMKSAGISKATVVGMSMGGAIAMNFALEHPEMVEALVTVASQLGGYHLREPTASRLRRILMLTQDSGLAKAKEAWLHDPFLVPVTRRASVAATIRQIVSDWSGVQFKRSTFASFLPLRPPAIERLEQIKVPVLAVVGELDDPNMRAIADTIAARVPGGKKQVVPGCGHLVNLERPEEFDRIVLDVVAGAVRR